MNRVYLDHNAASPLRPKAREAMETALAGAIGNPSSVHAEGRAARGRIDEARSRVARLIGAKPHEIVFTSSGTEACHLAIMGSIRPPARSGPIVATAIEHAAVMAPIEEIQTSGAPVDIIPVDASGRVIADRFMSAVTPGTTLAICMAANNETGVVQPFEELAERCAERGVRLFVDAVQAAGRIAIDVSRNRVDLLALSSHKIGGPSGAGALYVREGTVLTPVIAGGGQESGLRGGTECAPGLAGFGAAAALALAETEEYGSLCLLRDHLEGAVKAAVPGALVVGEMSERLANTSQFLVPFDDEEMLILALDRAGYAVSAGSACAAGSHQRSRVLQAMGVLGPGFSSLRVSFGRSTTVADVESFAAALARIVTPVESLR